MKSCTRCHFLLLSYLQPIHDFSFYTLNHYISTFSVFKSALSLITKTIVRMKELVGEFELLIHTMVNTHPLEIHLYQVQMLNLLKEIKMMYYHMAFSTAKSSQTRALMYSLQSVILGWLHQFYFLIHDCNGPGLIVLIPFEQNLLEQLADVQLKFPQYFCWSMKIPRQLQESEGPLLVKKIQDCLLAPAWVNIPGNIRDMLLHPYSKLLSINERITYQRLQYLQMLLHQLQELCCDQPDGQIPDHFEERLLKKLLLLNFNHGQLISHLTEKIRALLDQELRSAEKFAHLYQFQYQIEKLPHDESVFLYADTASCRLQLEKYIEREMKKLRAQQYVQSQTSISENEQPELIYTSLSVSQLAFLLRLLLDNGIFQFENKRELFRMICNAFKNKTGPISVSSFRNHFYDPDPATMKMVSDHLMELMNRSRKLRRGE